MPNQQGAFVRDDLSRVVPKGFLDGIEWLSELS